MDLTSEQIEASVVLFPLLWVLNLKDTESIKSYPEFFAIIYIGHKICIHHQLGQNRYDSVALCGFPSSVNWRVDLSSLALVTG